LEQAPDVCVVGTAVLVATATGVASCRVGLVGAVVLTGAEAAVELATAAIVVGRCGLVGAAVAGAVELATDVSGFAGGVAAGCWAVGTVINCGAVLCVGVRVAPATAVG